MPLKLNMAVFWALATTLAVTLLMVNCDNVRLSLLPTSDSLSSESIQQICTSAPLQGTGQSRVLFIVDESSSNFAGNDSRGIGTDPDKSYRYNSMKNYIDTHSANQNIYYSLITFKDVAAKALIHPDGDTSKAIFTNDLTKVYAGLSSFENDEVDAGATPYKAALTMAAAAIQADSSTLDPTIATNYAVVLISDGAPTDYGNPVANGTIFSDVQHLVSLAKAVTVSTLYYGPEDVQLDRDAASLLQQIAAKSGGNFLDTNISGHNIPLDGIVVLKQATPYVIKQFMVINLTSAPCDDGSIGPDSDADGLCDKDEINYNTYLAQDPVAGPRMKFKNFDPANRNSFANTYGDYINSLYFRYGEQFDLSCNSTTRSSPDFLTDCEKKFLTSVSAVGPTPTWTSLMGKFADAGTYDSDGDGFLDSIEFIYGRSRSSALDYNSIDQVIQGYRMDQILLQHRNPANPTDAVAYDPSFQSIGPNSSGQNCYAYNQTVLPLYHTLALSSANAIGFPELAHKTDENVILIYYIQTLETDPNGAGELHFTLQKIPYGTNGVNLNLNSGSYQVYKPKNALVNPP